jgi:hypothetical protein
VKNAPAGGAERLNQQERLSVSGLSAHVSSAWPTGLRRIEYRFVMLFTSSL